MSQESVVLNAREAKEIYSLISELSGHNPENVFAWDGSDSLEDPYISACVKIYRAVGARVPDHLISEEQP